MKYLVLVLALATVSFGYISHGPQVGIWLPTGDMADAYGTSFGVLYQLLYHMPVVAIEGSVGYVFLSSDFENVDAHLIPIAAGIRSYSGSLYAAGGLEYDNISSSVTVGGIETTESNGEIGAYIGGGLVNRMGFGKLDVSARAHWMDFDDFMISLTGGINF
ncbi:MAG: hypothetical protein R6V62_01815 [Candidatus Fermentibacteraceae bacterium]